jgi:dTMP kinase
MNTSNYISIEGLEGAGKSTCLEVVKQFLIDSGKDVKNVWEPGGTPLAQTLRSIVKEFKTQEVVNEKTEAMLFYASRNQLLENVVKPALAEGKVVLSDRSFWSSMAYQGTTPEMLSLLKDLNNHICTVVPRVVIFLDVDPELGMKRARERGELDNIEKRNIQFFKDCQTRFRTFAKENPYTFLTINANQSVDKVKQDVIKALEFHRFTHG